MQRSLQQNKSCHKYFTELADALNEAGVDQRLFIDHLKGWEVPITADFIKHIWKLKQQKMFLTDSTTKMTTDQVSKVYDQINMFVGQEFGVHTPFPSSEL